MFKTYERKNFKTYGTDEHVLFETYETKGHKFVRLLRMSSKNACMFACSFVTYVSQKKFVCSVCLKKVRLLRMTNQLLFRLFGV